MTQVLLKTALCKILTTPVTVSVGFLSQVLLYHGRRNKSGLVPSELVPTTSLPRLRRGPLPFTRPRAATPSKLTLPPSLHTHNSPSNIVDHSYRSKLSFHKLIATISEPFEVVVILYLPKDRLWFNRPLTSVLHPILTCHQFSGHRSQFIVPVIHPVQCKTKEGDET